MIHWIDNTSALAALVKGYAAAEDSAKIVHAFHSFSVGLKSTVWFEYVASKANIADMPSRGDFEELDRLGSIEHACVMPSVDAWHKPADAWMARAQQRAPTGKTRRRPGPSDVPPDLHRRRRRGGTSTGQE